MSTNARPGCRSCELAGTALWQAVVPPCKHVHAQHFCLPCMAVAHPQAPPHRQAATTRASRRGVSALSQRPRSKLPMVFRACPVRRAPVRTSAGVPDGAGHQRRAAQRLSRHLHHGAGRKDEHPLQPRRSAQGGAESTAQESSAKKSSAEEGHAKEGDGQEVRASSLLVPAAL